MTETVLQNFGSSAGANPLSGVIRDEAGNLYGTTSSGGDSGACGGAGCGTVYKVNRAGELTVLYTFTAVDAANSSGVIRDSAGNLYGTTQSPGTGNWGVVYKLNPAGQETVLYRFTGGADGACPTGVIRDPEGNLYGTTECGAGVVYKLDPTGHLTVLHTFTGGADGGFYASGVIRDRAGNLYGTTNGGGNLSASPCVGYGCGVVYKLDPSGNETVLYTFAGGADGALPNAGVILDSAGNLYGTATGGGNLSACSGGCGLVFKLDPSGSETVLYTFTGGADGGIPWSGVIRDPAGNLYGTTLYGGDTGTCNVFGCGVVYRVATSGKETVLHTFTGASDGGQPYSGVIPDAAGDIYGTTYSGGSGGAGVLYKLSR